MTRQKMTDLKRVTEARFQKEFERLRPVLAAEAHVQGQLARLDVQANEVRAASQATEGYRTTGTDVLWHGWESGTRIKLNTELARLRAQKLEALAALRKSFGRNQAVDQLTQDLKKQARQDQARKRSIY